MLISHFLSEIKALSDRITVLRDGRHIATLQAGDSSEAQLIDLMLQRTGGVDASEQEIQPVRAFGNVVLDVSDWKAGGVEVEHFAIHAGEIIGLIGLTGAGHFGFARSLYAASGVTDGTYLFQGEVQTKIDARTMQKKAWHWCQTIAWKTRLLAIGTYVKTLQWCTRLTRLLLVPAYCSCDAKPARQTG